MVVARRPQLRGVSLSCINKAPQQRGASWQNTRQKCAFSSVISLQGHWAFKQRRVRAEVESSRREIWKEWIATPFRGVGDREQRAVSQLVKNWNNWQGWYFSRPIQACLPFWRSRIIIMLSRLGKVGQASMRSFLPLLLLAAACLLCCLLEQLGTCRGRRAPPVEARAREWRKEGEIPSREELGRLGKTRVGQARQGRKVTLR